MGTVKDLNKKAMRIKIIDVQEQNCTGCKYRYKQRHCLRDCEIGKQIQELGKRLGAKPPEEMRNRRTKAEWDIICEKALIMKEQGMTYVQIAKQLGIKASYIGEQVRKRKLN
ncbi:zinc-finger domain-containing protein [Bacillus mycoides]|uniref:zinc-finger domain-containing protein n=1 Tax=Bacillus mycoides TaxID=1405 RepID=UPI0022B42C95|nr:zinc-finger domain-containing protein [Bacillus mycoides]